MALKIVMEDMAPHEVAMMYQQGEDAIIMISRHLSDDVRCQAVNDLLGRVQAREIRPRALSRVMLSVVA